VSAAPYIKSGSALLKGVAGSNPYVAALTTVVDLSMNIVQSRQRKENERVDASANDFTEHTLTFAAAGEQRVNHKLDRVPAGYNVVSSTADTRVFKTSEDERSIGFDAAGTFPVTVKIRVF
jgi:hypothetical protein